MILDRQESIDFDTIEEALAHEPKWDICQLKYDGLWANVNVPGGVQKLLDPRTQWISRTGDTKKKELSTLEPGSYIGEYMFGSHWAQQNEHLGKTYLFDTVWDGTNDLRGLSYARRYGILHDRVTRSGDPKLALVSNIDIRLATKLWERVLAASYEGIIFRRLADDYSGRIGRLKREVTGEFVVVGIIPGEGQHVGRMGAFQLGLYIGGTLVESFKVGNGFSHLQRQEFWDQWPRDRGRVVECIGKSRFPSGALRHITFGRFRDDKRPEECQWVTPQE